MNARTPRRRLAPLVVEQLSAVILCGGLTLVTAGGVAGDRPGLVVIDALLFAACAAVLLFGLRQRRLKWILVAPSAPPEARFDSERKTIAIAAIAAPVVAVVLGALSVDAGPAMPVFYAVVAAALAWDGLMIRRWERRNGGRFYRERLIFARRAPFFYRSWHTTH